MDPLPSRQLAIRGVACLVILAFVLGSVVVTAQQQNPNAPLQRQSVTFTQGSVTLVTDDLLDAAETVYIQNDVPIGVTVRFRCIESDGSLDNNCDIGTQSGTANLERQIQLVYNLTGGDPVTSPDGTPVTLTSTGQHLPGDTNDVTFAGEIPAARFQSVANGINLTWAFRVPLAENEASCALPVCHDPIHTTGEDAYSATVDSSVPTLLVSQPSNPRNAKVFEVSPTQWYLYSCTQCPEFGTTGGKPTILFSVLDNESGAPLDKPSTVIRSGSDDWTERFAVVTPANAHAQIFRYDWSAPGRTPFAAGDHFELDIDAQDQAGQHLTSAGANGIHIVMDEAAPTVNTAASQSFLERQSGNTSDFVSSNENLTVQVTASDMGGGISTPTQFLTATVRLFNNTTFSAPFVLEHQNGKFVNDHVRVPDNWVNGVTKANVTVVDAVGRSFSTVISGEVRVDAADPVIDLRSPMDGTQSTAFTQEPTVTFRMRVTDPGDADPWNSGDPSDTDGFGIEEVNIRYKIGKNGPLQTGVATAQEAEGIYRWVTTFDIEDQVYFFVETSDHSGNIATMPAAGDPNVKLDGVSSNGGRFFFLQVDKKGPSIEAVGAPDFIGGDPHVVRFGVSDGGIGVDPASVRFYWRSGTTGNFREVPMTETQQTHNNATVFSASIPTQEDGTSIQYYVTAQDGLGNVGNFGSVSSPKGAVIDLTAPTVTMNAPANTTNPRFNITWTGTDTASGIAHYTLQFRIAPGGDWFTVPTRTETTHTTYEVCAATGKTYEFRLRAEDRAGNVRGFPQAPDGSTVVDASTSCADAPTVSISQPTAGSEISGNVQFQWNAVSTSAAGDLSITILAVQGGQSTALAESVANSGSFTWASASLNVQDVCIEDGTYTFRVIARDPNNLDGQAEVRDVTVENGIVDCDDRDNDGLSDAWETANFGGLDAGPNDDPDDDGFNNEAELRAGTDPNDANSRPRSNNGGPSGPDVQVAGWNNLYILVILAFIAVLAVFVVGMTRRW